MQLARSPSLSPPRRTAAPRLGIILAVAVLGACASAARPAPLTPTAPTAPTVEAGAACDVRQGQILHDADARAAPYSTAQHLAKNFADGKVSWLMTDAAYQKFVVATGAKKWGRCNDTGCYVFVAPAQVIHDAVAAARTGDHHDPAALGKALGLPPTSFEGPLRLMTLELAAAAACARLPVDDDPGVWKCKTPDDKDCFKFGGYTSGGVPELIVIDAPVERTTIEPVP